MKDSFLQKINTIPVKIIAMVSITFAVGMAIGAFGYTKFIKKEGTPKVVVNYPLPEIIEEQRPTSKDAKTFNIILMGSGGAGHSGGGLMDAIILVHVNVTDKKAALVSIPRDLWFSGHKINADPSIKDAVSGITGLSISNFIKIDFGSFIKMIDSLGGVTVETKKAYVDNFYPVRGKENELCDMSPDKVAELHTKYSGFELEKQFTCRYETISYGVGPHEMSGDDALKYVRSRHGDGDFGRSRRQFEVLKAILQKANIKSVETAFDFVNTDLDLSEVNTILEEVGNPLDYSVSSINLTDENVLVSGKSNAGAYILEPKNGDYNSIKEFIKSSL